MPKNRRILEHLWKKIGQLDPPMEWSLTEREEDEMIRHLDRLVALGQPAAGKEQSK
jgi:hypothetical protein